MELEVVNRLNKFTLLDDEEHGLSLEDEDIKDSVEDCQKSLYGQIYGEKVENYTGLKNIIPVMWPGCGPVRVKELGVNTYQFFFQSNAEKLRILHSKVWLFDLQFLILRQWSAVLDPVKEKFNKVVLWIQVWNLPSHWLSKQVGFRFKSLFGRIVDVLIPESGSKLGQYLRVSAEVDLGKPLLRGTKLRLHEQTIWIDFKYENLATFCFYCGRVGHQEKSCTPRKMDAEEGVLTEGQYGDWLRASLIRNHSSSRTSANQSQHYTTSHNPTTMNQQRQEPLKDITNKALGLQMRPCPAKTPTEKKDSLADMDLSAEKPISTDHLKIGESHTSFVDSEEIPSFPSAPEELVNIPISLGRTTQSSPLHTNSDKGKGTAPPSPNAPHPGRRFRKRIGKENAKPSNTCQQPMEGLELGKKRSWQLIDEDTESATPACSHKKMKEQHNLQVANLTEVEVASLNWAQLNK